MIRPITTPAEIQATADLAKVIWSDHYIPIIGREQVDYMLDKFQSAAAITAQIEEQGYDYYLLWEDETVVGYLALIPEHPPGKMMISKIYVHRSGRGRGYGRQLLEFAILQARERKAQALWLTVNRGNDSSVAWYRKNGFSVVEEIKMDIGRGFVMDDYKLELLLG